MVLLAAVLATVVRVCRTLAPPACPPPHSTCTPQRSAQANSSQHAQQLYALLPALHDSPPLARWQVSRAGLGEEPTFIIPEYDLTSLLQLPLYLPLGLLVGATAILFTRASAAAAAAAKRAQAPVAEAGAGIPTVLLPPLGGLFAGSLALAYPEILYQARRHPFPQPLCTASFLLSRKPCFPGSPAFPEALLSLPGEPPGVLSLPPSRCRHALRLLIAPQARAPLGGCAAAAAFASRGGPLGRGALTPSLWFRARALTTWTLSLPTRAPSTTQACCSSLSLLRLEANPA